MYTITMALKGEDKHVGRGDTLEDALLCLMNSAIDNGTPVVQASLATCHRETVLAGVVSALFGRSL